MNTFCCSQLVNLSRRLFLVLLLATCASIGIAGEYQIYFGDLHAHTGNSDGTGTPAQAFQQAKSSGRADFLAITDHAQNAGTISSTEWTNLVNAANACTDATFVGIAGYEYTLSWGHMNAFDVTGPDGSKLGRVEYYDKLASTGIIAQWNHPLYKSTNNFNNFSDLTPARDRAICLLELINGGGSPREASYQMALDKGWHVSPTANSDTHDADWITGFSSRTAVLAPILTRANIYDALRNNRTYATQDRNLKIHFKIDGQVLGSTVAAASSHTVTVNVDDPDTVVSKIDLITNGGTLVASKSIGSKTGSWSTTVPSPSVKKYYFVKVTNASGKKAWTAPIWVLSGGSPNQPPACSITSPAAGASFTAPANVTIQASASDPDGSVAKVEFFRGSTKLGEDTTAPYTFGWSNVVAGSYSLTARAIDNLGATKDSAAVSITVSAPAVPTVTFTAAAQSRAENGGTATVTARLSAASTQAVTVPFTVGGTATRGTDFTISVSPITIAAGSLEGTATITILNDTAVEGNETVIVTMGTPANATKGATTVHTLTITDDDSALMVAFTAAAQSKTEGAGMATVTARLSAASAQTVTVPFTVAGTATKGTDYNVSASPITIAAGSLEGTATITVLNDTAVEGNETVIVTMGTPANATKGTPGVHTLTITDDDNAAGLLVVNVFGTSRSLPILSYGGGQDVKGTAVVGDGGATLHMKGNIWKMVDLGSVAITADTVLEFDYTSTVRGEIHGIGFDNDTSMSSGKTFQLYGTQSWGLSNYRNYATVAPATKHYAIPVGTHFTGNSKYLFFVNDHDVSVPTAEGRFSNIKILTGK